MRHLAVSALLIAAGIVAGQHVHALEVEDRVVFGPDTAATTLRVLSTADTDVFSPVIAAFQQDYPDVAVDYIVASSSAVMDAVQDDEAAFDIVISSAMDLQTKLANDGFAAPHVSDLAEGIPNWARWRNNLFAFTWEPAAMVFSPQYFDGQDIPQTRRALMGILRQTPERFRGKIGTYDVRASGLGYLFATQDARTSDTFWSLTEIFGFLDAKLYCCSSQMIDAVAAGDLAVAYNVLGSYVAARDDAETLALVYPEDFRTVMLRTAFVPANAPSKPAAHDFLDHLLAIAWDDKPLDDYGFERLSSITPSAVGNSSQIGLGPGLLVYLDRLKKTAFLRAWESAVAQ